VSATGPEEIYERNRREGERRLARPPVELISTALAAGVDIIAGVIAAALVTAQLGGGGGKVAGAVAFGIGFVFLVFGRRFGADIPWSFVAGNLGLAAAGNMLGGIGLVTLNRLTQGTAGARTRHS
jgi:formate/nitrite transporter FocA (FNT family)